MCIGGTLTQNLFGDFQLSRILMNMHWWNLNTKSFRRFSAIKKTYWHALAGLHHKIFSTTFSYQEYLLTCIGGTLTHNLFGDFQLSRMHIDMHWWDFTTKSFWRLSVIKNSYSHSLMGPKLKFFRRLSAIKITYWHVLVWPEHKSFRRFSAVKNTYWDALVGPYHKIFSVNLSHQKCILTCIGGTLPQNIFGDFQRSRLLMDAHWWDLNKKSFRWISAIKNAYWHALVGIQHKIFSPICSDQEYLYMCIGGTLTQNLFGDFQLSRILMNMHWWNLNTKSFRRFSAIKKTYWHALAGLHHKIFSTTFSYQEYLLTCIGGTLTHNLFGDFQLSRMHIDMHWWDLNA